MLTGVSEKIKRGDSQKFRVLPFGGANRTKVELFFRRHRSAHKRG